MPSQQSDKLQLNEHGRLRHFLTIEGLSRELLLQILDTAESFATLPGRPVKKVPLLRGRIITNLFFENSTRTRTTFELAAKLLSADVINFNISTSATSKGETLLDTLRNIEAMHSDMFVVRHAPVRRGTLHCPACLTAGERDQRRRRPPRPPHPGHAGHVHHPQAQGRLHPLRVAIVGDVLHSRVARSQILALNTLGVSEVRIVGPRTLLPTEARALGVHVFHDLEEGIRDVDVVIMLRLQNERMDGALLPNEHEYFRLYGLTDERLENAKPDAIVMHPGPNQPRHRDGLGGGRRPEVGGPAAGQLRHRGAHGRDVHGDAVTGGPRG